MNKTLLGIIATMTSIGLGISVGHAREASFTSIENLPRCSFKSTASGVLADEFTVVGTSNGTNGDETFRCTENDSIVFLDNPLGEYCICTSFVVRHVSVTIVNSRISTEIDNSSPNAAVTNIRNWFLQEATGISNNSVTIVDTTRLLPERNNEGNRNTGGIFSQGSPPERTNERDRNGGGIFSQGQQIPWSKSLSLNWFVPCLCFAGFSSDSARI